MADPARRWPENAPGAFFVDDGCIDCDLCLDHAPEHFVRSDEGYKYVAVQPTDEASREACTAAMNDCPVVAIGDLDEEPEDASPR